MCILFEDGFFDVFDACFTTEYHISKGFSSAFLFASERNLRVYHICEGGDCTCTSNGDKYVIDACVDIKACGAQPTIVTCFNTTRDSLDDDANEVNYEEECMNDKATLSGQ